MWTKSRRIPTKDPGWMLWLWRVLKVIVLGFFIALLAGLLTRSILAHLLGWTRIHH
ncbi:MAG: hypothetical protein H7833_17500 [Magnetococcus sp. DMHC-1]|nr:hypothetical protein [Magnetococcales bacterium]